MKIIIGLAILFIVSSLFGCLLAILEDKHERWTRTYDEDDYFEFKSPKWLDKDGN